MAHFFYDKRKYSYTAVLMVDFNALAHAQLLLLFPLP